MTKIRTLQNSFVSGELDPLLFGRIDTKIYKKAAAKLRNVYVLPQGGVARREGMEFITTLNTVSSNFRLVSFEFNDVQTYILAFSDNGGGEMVVVTADDGVVQTTITSSVFAAFNATTIKEMTWAQTADTLILFHNDFKPIKIFRISNTVWTISEINFLNVPVFAYSGITITPSTNVLTSDLTAGIVILTSSTATMSPSFVGQFINTEKGGRVFVTDFISTTQVKCIVIIELEGTITTTGTSSGGYDTETGYEPVFSATRGFIGAGSFHNSRLWLGNVGERPQTILASQIGDFFNLDVGSGLDDEAINVTIDDNTVNRVVNIFSGRGLQIYTTGGEFVVSSSDGSAVTPLNIPDQLNKQTLHGSGNDQVSVSKQTPRPVSVDGATLFVEIGGNVVRQFVFNDTEQSFNATNVSIFSSQLIRDPVSMDIRRSTEEFPSDFVYMVNSDGTCAVLNSLREQDLLAWSLFETAGLFKDVAVAGRKVYFIVERIINGVSVKFLERLNASHFMDASTLQTATQTTSWSNLTHLNGELIRVRGDEFLLDDETPTTGNITSSIAVSKLEAGLNFQAKILTLPLDTITDDASGSKQSQLGQFKAPRWANIRLFKSRDIIVNYNNKRQIIPFLTFGQNILDENVPLSSDFKKVYLGGYDREVQLEITQEDPLEFVILTVVFGLRT